MHIIIRISYLEWLQYRENRPAQQMIREYLFCGQPDDLKKQNISIKTMYKPIFLGTISSYIARCVLILKSTILEYTNVLIFELCAKFFLEIFSFRIILFNMWSSEKSSF